MCYRLAGPPVVNRLSLCYAGCVELVSVNFLRSADELNQPMWRVANTGAGWGVGRGATAPAPRNSVCRTFGLAFGLELCRTLV